MATSAKKVYLSHNLPKKPTRLPDNMTQVGGIKCCVGPSSFSLTDGGTVSDVDTILFCTGYEYYFPFLDSSCKVLKDTYAVLKKVIEFIELSFKFEKYLFRSKLSRRV